MTATLESPDIRAVLRDIGDHLAAAGIDGAAAEARDLVAAVLERPRFWPRLHPDETLDAGSLARLRAAADLRAEGAPFAYAVGRAAFRHLTLLVDERVLIPRQETELLVDLVLRECAANGLEGGTVADLGTGSGAIALALATEGRFDRVIGTDVSADALVVARRNAAMLATSLRAAVEFRGGSAGAPLAGETLDVLVTNPPYIDSAEACDLPASVRDWEPPLAFFSGGGGLDVTLEIARTAPDLMRRGGLLAMEVDNRRAARVAEAVERTGAFHSISVHRDLAGRERFVLARRS